MKPEVREVTNTLGRVFRTVHQRSYYKMENKNIYPGQPKLLLLIKEHEGITQKELSKMSFVTPATITGMLNKLEANHYVYRVPDETDRRIMRVYLTPEGLNLAEVGQKLMESMIDQLFDGLSDDELQTLLELANKLKSNLSIDDKNSLFH